MRGKPIGRASLLAGACYAAAALACCVLAADRHGAFGDLRIYRSGGAALAHGERLYDLRFAWNLGFTYPPFAAIVFTSLAATPWPVLPPLVTAVSVVALPVSCWLALRLPVRPVTGQRAITLALAASAAAIWLEPVRTNLGYGQINLIVTALILYDLSRDDSARYKGAAIGLAAGLKLTPAIFAVYLAATRRYRAAAVSAGVFCLTVATGFAVAPGDSAQFWAGRFASPQHVGRIENAANQSLRGALARLVHTANPGPWWLLAAAAVGAGGLTLAAIAGRRGDAASGFCLCAVTGLLVSPVSWSHHWVLAVPALLLAAVRGWQRGRGWEIAAVALLAAIGWSRIIWQVPIGRGDHAELHLNPLQLGYADAYVAAGLAVLVVAAWQLARRPDVVKEHPDGQGDADRDVVPAAHDLDGADAVLREPGRHGGGGRAAVRLLPGQYRHRASGRR